MAVPDTTSSMQIRLRQTTKSNENPAPDEPPAKHKTLAYRGKRRATDETPNVDETPTVCTRRVTWGPNQIADRSAPSHVYSAPKDGVQIHSILHASPHVSDYFNNSPDSPGSTLVGTFRFYLQSVRQYTLSQEKLSTLEEAVRPPPASRKARSQGIRFPFKKGAAEKKRRQRSLERPSSYTEFPRTEVGRDKHAKAQEIGSRRTTSKKSFAKDAADSGVCAKQLALRDDLLKSLEDIELLVLLGDDERSHRSHCVAGDRTQASAHKDAAGVNGKSRRTQKLQEKLHVKDEEDEQSTSADDEESMSAEEGESMSAEEEELTSVEEEKEDSRIAEEVKEQKSTSAKQTSSTLRRDLSCTSLLSQDCEK